MPPAIKKGATTVSVTDIKLAASLMALGIPPVPGEEVNLTTGDVNHVSFNFLPWSTSEDADSLSADDIVAAWAQEREATTREDEWSYQNPNHPLSYLMCAWDNFLCVRDYVRKARPKIYIQRGKSVALIDPERTTQKEQDYILGRIGV